MNALDALDRKSRSTRSPGTFYKACVVKFNRRRCKPSPTQAPTPPVLSNTALFLFIVKRSYGGKVWWVGDDLHSSFGPTQMGRALYNPALYQELHDHLSTHPIKLTSMDYKAATAKAKRGDVIYFDPPYHETDIKNNVGRYHSSGFADKQQIELARWCATLQGRGCTVIVSNSDTPLIRQLYKKFEMCPVRVNRTLDNAHATHRMVPELLIANIDLKRIHSFK